MPNIADKQYTSKQYRNSANLNARLQLHARFSINKYGWQRWVFDQLTLGPHSRILELGCGTCRLWLDNLDRIPVNWQITLSDISTGMVAEAQSELHNDRRFSFSVIDAQAIDLDNASYDAVVANHMLYHLPNRDKALAEIHRILKPGGQFFASTIGKGNLREMHELIADFDASLPLFDTNLSQMFTLENGLDELTRWFTRITLQQYIDALVITETEPLFAYVLSMDTENILTDEKITAFRAFIQKRMARDGALHISKAAGLFQALKG